MVRSKRHAILTVLVCLTVLLAGCSGWGTDGPMDEDAESNGSDDLEEADAEADDDGTADEADDDGADGADDADTDDGEPPESGTDDDESDDETDAPEDDADGETDADDGDAEEGGEADEAEGDGTDDNEADTDDADEGDADENDGSTLTVETADVVTGEPVDADVISLEQDGETVGEVSGESATFDGLADGEYDLELHDSFGDWAYGDTITIDGEDATHVAEIDQGHTYWPGVAVTVVDGDGEPVEGETVTINGEEFVTGADGTVEDETESSYTDEREFVVEYGEQSETVQVDWESWDGGLETVTFETENGGDADENDDANAALTITA